MSERFENFAVVPPEMLPDGESMAAYKLRVGPSNAHFYGKALARHRERLAAERGITPEQLHDGYLTPVEQQRPDADDLGQIEASRLQ
jgi:hypothetical protein